MDAKIITGRLLPLSAVGTYHRGVNYRATDATELLGYRDDFIPGKGEACGVPLTNLLTQAVEGVRIRLGHTVRGVRELIEPLDKSIVADLHRIKAEVVK